MNESQGTRPAPELVRVLMVEDSEDDAQLVLAELRRSGVEFTHDRVMNEADLREALRQEWDIILSDNQLPYFDALGTLRVVKDMGLDIPIIVVSGTLEEEKTAAKLLHAGAQDFIQKNRLARLGPALIREVREGKLRAEQRRMREQLMLTERMASIGILAAGVAHEINNPAAVLMMTLELISHQIETAEPYVQAALMTPNFKRFMADAHEASNRIHQIARDVTTFSRSDSSPSRVPVKLEAVLASSVRMARPQVRARAHVVEDIAPLHPVLAPEGRLGQLFLNLLVNAAQAIPESGGRDHEIRIGAHMLAGERAEVTISDTGCGIPAQNLDHIFDPFFTTKPAGIGTGLGLPICKRIVTDLGGEIFVRSELERGTTFTVVLPTAN